jgi:phasin family protein
MTSRATRSSINAEPAENPAVAAFEAWVDMNRPVVAAMTELNERFIEQMTRANSEWIGFLNRRLNEDVAASHRIMECKTPQDFVAAYSEVFQRAQAQYQAEFQHFARLNQKLAKETAGVVQSHMAEIDAEMRH